MSNYNLTDNVNDSFQFSIKGIVYDMRYPLMEELEELQKKSQEIESKKAKGKDTSKDDKELMDWMFSFATPVDENSPPLKDIIQKQNIKVIQNFQTMFKTEFGATE